MKHLPPLAIVVAFALPLVGCSKQVFTGKREARGVWMSRFEYTAETARISPEESQRRIREVFEQARRAKFNMIIFQVRGNGDAFYRSAHEPWSQRLTGTLGQDPGWDPLQFAIDEARRLGLELHAWINTFPIWRGKTPPPESTPRSMYLEHPEWLVCDNDGRPMPLSDHYVNISPSVPAARQHTLNVVMDMVEKYNVDGIHFDYIRYPEELTTRGYSHDSISVARFNSKEDAAHLLHVTGRNTIQYVDTVPLTSDAYYAVSAQDRLGNESELSNVASVGSMATRLFRQNTPYRLQQPTKKFVETIAMSQ